MVAPPPTVAALPPVVGDGVGARPVAEQLFAAGDAAPAFTDPDRRAKLAAAFPALDKALEQERAKQGLPGVAVGIVIDGELAYAKGSASSIRRRRPSRMPTRSIASARSRSRSPACALLSLRDDGVLGLDDPLARWIPEASKLVYPTRDERPITLRQLTQHTWPAARGPFEAVAGPDEATVVGSLAKIELERAAGIESVYSNLGFSLARNRREPRREADRFTT